MPAIRRTLKNVVKNYSECQVKVREATSNDPWGPSSTLMSEISDLTYNVVAFTEIMQMVWKRLNDDGKNWRHVYKSLVVLDYIIKTGSEKVAQQCKENFHAIKTLTSFQYIDADHKDQGMNVREKAKQLVNMLSDDERLKNERAKALKAKERYALNAQGVGSRPGAVRLRTHATDNSHRTGYTDTPSYPDSSPGSGSAGTPSEIENARPSSAGEEELQLQLALAMSKEEHDESVRKQKSDDIKLQMALEQSREQEKSPGGTLLDLAGPSSAGAQAASTDPWGAPLPSQPAPPSTDPWGTPLPPPASNPDPWGTSGGGRAEPPPAYSPTMGGSASIPAQPVQPTPDPWGLPVATPAPPPGAWASTSPTLPQGTSWGGSSSAFPQQTPSSNLDPFGAPTTNGASSVNTLDNEFDLLSARSSDSSPVKSPQGLEEFDTLAGGTQANGSSPDAWDMSGMNQGLHDGKKKDAKDFLGANANLVNLDQLVSKAPPKGNNPFAMMPDTSISSNPFQDPNANVRRPMAQMQASSHNQGFSQPVSSGGLLPAPLLPMGSNPPLQQQPPPAAQQSYNPFL